MARKRPDPGKSPQLPPFIVEEAEAAGWIRIECGYKDCRGVAYVKRGKWLHGRKGRNYVGRPCTYCFRAGRIPDNAASGGQHP